MKLVSACARYSGTVAVLHNAEVCWSHVSKLNSMRPLSRNHSCQLLTCSACAVCSSKHCVRHGIATASRVIHNPWYADQLRCTILCHSDRNGKNVRVRTNTSSSLSDTNEFDGNSVRVSVEWHLYHNSRKNYYMQSVFPSRIN